MKEQLQKLLKQNQQIIDFEYKQTGTDDEGFPIFAIDFINPPQSYKLVKLFEPLKFAILEDLTINKD